MCRGGEYSQREKGENMHDCRSYFLWYVVESVPADCDTIYTSATSRCGPTVQGLIDGIHSLQSREITIRRTYPVVRAIQGK